MIKCNKKTMALLLCGVLLVLVMSNSSQAQEQNNVVTGRTYAMYFLSLSFNDEVKELNQMDVMFNEGGSISAMEMKGHGLYFAIPGFFIGTFFAVGVTMKFETMDIFAAMTGIIIDPFITGIGFFLIDYTTIIPYVFTGFQLVNSTM